MSFDYHEYRTVKISAYSLNLNKQLVEAFRAFATMYIGRGRKPLQKKEFSENFTHTQLTNWQNIRYFGVTEVEDGKWSLTDLGEDFYDGSVPIQTPCGFMQGEILPDTHNAWNTFKGKREWLFIHDFLDDGIKKREDFREERRGDTLFTDEEERNTGPADPDPESQPELPYPEAGGSVQNGGGEGVPGGSQTSVFRSLLRG